MVDIKYDKGFFSITLDPKDAEAIDRFGRIQSKIGNKPVSIYPTDGLSRGEAYNHALAFHIPRGLISCCGVPICFDENKLEKVEN